jgi:hypothetical protein
MIEYPVHRTDSLSFTSSMAAVSQISKKRKVWTSMTDAWMDATDTPMDYRSIQSKKFIQAIQW